MLRYYFGELRYQKVVAEVYGFNDDSISFHESLGFVLEGRLRQMIYTGGEYHDMLMFGMTSEEFSTGHGSTMEA
jgi:RimJ/RimL family protein N-acetyltransferase